jgi:probable HAF family extracellular repeat protein
MNRPHAVLEELELMITRSCLTYCGNIAVAFHLILVTNGFASTTYTIQDLGPPGRVSIPGQLNNEGAAAFWLPGESTSQNAFGIPEASMLFDHNTQIVLPSLGGYSNGAYDVNDNGVVVGYSSVDSPTALSRAVRYSNGNIEDLNVTPGQSTANSINDVGQIVGAGQFGDGYYAFLWKGPDDVTVLGSLGGKTSYPFDINNKGIVVGDSELAPEPNGDVHGKAFTYKNGQMSALDVFGAQNSTATAINESGQIVGEYRIGDNTPQPFLIDPTTGTHDIGLPGLVGGALDINDLGMIVGSSQRSADADTQDVDAFVYDAANGLQFLQDLIPPDSGWTKLLYANSINNRGQILGQGLINGESHVFLATPTPEPSSACCAIIGMVVLQIFTRASRPRLATHSSTPILSHQFSLNFCAEIGPRPMLGSPR